MSRSELEIDNKAAYRQNLVQACLAHTLASPLGLFLDQIGLPVWGVLLCMLVLSLIITWQVFQHAQERDLKSHRHQIYLKDLEIQALKTEHRLEVQQIEANINRQLANVEGFDASVSLTAYESAES